MFFFVFFFKYTVNGWSKDKDGSCGDKRANEIWQFGPDFFKCFVVSFRPCDGHWIGHFRLFLFFCHFLFGHRSEPRNWNQTFGFISRITGPFYMAKDRWIYQQIFMSVSSVSLFRDNVVRQRCKWCWPLSMDLVHFCFLLYFGSNVRDYFILFYL